MNENKVITIKPLKGCGDPKCVKFVDEKGVVRAGSGRWICVDTNEPRELYDTEKGILSLDKVRYEFPCKFCEDEHHRFQVESKYRMEHFSDPIVDRVKAILETRKSKQK